MVVALLDLAARGMPDPDGPALSLLAACVSAAATWLAADRAAPGGRR